MRLPALPIIHRANHTLLWLAAAVCRGKGPHQLPRPGAEPQPAHGLATRRLAAATFWGLAAILLLAAAILLKVAATGLAPAAILLVPAAMQHRAAAMLFAPAAILFIPVIV